MLGVRVEGLQVLLHEVQVDPQLLDPGASAPHRKVEERRGTGRARGIEHVRAREVAVGDPAGVEAAEGLSEGTDGGFERLRRNGRILQDLLQRRARDLLEREPVVDEVDVVQDRGADAEATRVDQEPGLGAGPLPTESLVERLRSVARRIALFDERRKPPPVDPTQLRFRAPVDRRSLGRFRPGPNL